MALSVNISYISTLTQINKISSSIIYITGHFRKAPVLCMCVDGKNIKEIQKLLN